jgi:putative effector of murein hydrolase LrgA (UPF0299 family)
MKISEEADIKWVLIVTISAISIFVVTLLTRPLAGALWALVLVCLAGWWGLRWAARKQRGR